MKYKKVSSVDLDYFHSFLGKSGVFSDDESIHDYSHDETEDLKYFPEIVLKPSNTDEVSKIMRYCNEQYIPVTPCGARTGLSGGSLPVCGGVAMSMERFNNIIEIDERNLQATVEPGVINQVFKDAVQEKGLLWEQL